MQCEFDHELVVMNFLSIYRILIEKHIAFLMIFLKKSGREKEREEKEKVEIFLCFFRKIKKLNTRNKKNWQAHPRR